MKIRVPFTIFADFEYFIIINGSENSSKISHKNILSHHIPCRYAYVIIGPTGKTFKKDLLFIGEITL